MKKNKFLIVAVIIAVLVSVVLIVLSISQNFESVEPKVITDKNAYNIGENLKVEIENNLRKDICFSSCYPYYFEKKGIGWKPYPYIECPSNDFAETCIDPNQIKAFELSVPSVETGPHRLAIPACLGCSVNEVFRIDTWLHSNSFIVK